MFKKILKKRNTHIKSLTKRVEILKCSKQYSWYKNLIGLKIETFKDIDNKYFITKSKIPNNSINRGFILKKDTMNIKNNRK